MTSELFDPLYGIDAVADTVDDGAWLRAIVAVEAALSRALGDAGAAERADADAAAALAGALELDPAEIGRDSVSGGNPVIPVVNRLRAAATAAGLPSGSVHRGATSQDVMDTALVLLIRDASARVADRLWAGSDHAAGLARAHRDTPAAARTLGQQALPTTFGALASGWALGLAEAAADVAAAAAALPVQFGGAAGTLAALYPHGLDVADALADRLGLPRQVTVWHTRRRPLHLVAGALGSACGTVSKVATDVVLMASTEVGEVAEAFPGGSSAMPHKRNPTAAVTARADARRAPGLVATLLASSDHEFARAAGPWHAEWPTVTELLRVTGGAAARLAVSLDGLVVHTDALAHNLDITRGALLAERVTGALAPYTPDARRIVTDACLSGLRLDTVDAITTHVPADHVRELLDPAGYLGHAGDLVDRALARVAQLRRTTTTITKETQQA
ncbi:3-carboxy-cis,cis-muconate cycloisomerase [Tsukamurella soli]|uniref:3-carboxy-cis,cis-muconate cycloisomerase n=1 Tax=Tsukamurella soli TaxID=644556 RepID=A0ABP8KCC9_9ACTN